MIVTALLVGSLLVGAQPIQDEAAFWPRFRGAQGAGVADGGAYPDKLDPESNLAWKVPAPAGNSSPCVWGGRIFITGEGEPFFTAAGERSALIVRCLARSSGELIWQRSIQPSNPERLHRINSPATPTSCTDGEVLVSYFGSFGLIAHDFTGQELWRREVPAARNTFGTGASPIMAGGHLIFLRDVNGASFLEALDPATGELRWRVERPSFKSGWSTPAVRRVGDVDELLVYGVWWLTAYDLATGEERWSVPGLTDEPIVTPVHGSDLVFLTSYNMKTNTEVTGLPEFSALLAELDSDGDGSLNAEEAAANDSVLSRHDADGEGDHPLRIFFNWLDADRDGELTDKEWVTLVEWIAGFEHANGLLAVRHTDGAAEIVWQHGRGVPECPSPLYYRGHVYLVKNGGIATCLDAASGALQFEGRTGARGPHYASPVAADGKIYTCAARGQVAVLSAGPELEVLSLTDLGERIMATPALADGQVLVRTEQHLYAFE